MKHIKAVIRPEKLQDVLSSLDRTGYDGIMITEVEGHGRQKGITHQWRGEKYQLELIPKVMLDLVVHDSDVKSISEAIVNSARMGEVGDGKIFIYNIEQVIRIRTGEVNDNAL